MVIEGNPVVARRFRGGELESLHRGCWVVTDAAGTVIAGSGDPDQPIFARSASKSLQALASIALDLPERFGLDARHLAVMVSSHNGEPDHVDVVASLLDAIGLDERALMCGQAAPFDDPKAPKRRIVHNCSGKHAGFLAGAVALGQDPLTYLDANTELQMAVQTAVCAVAGLDDGDWHLAVDGCSAPTFVLPLRALARGIARVCTPTSLPAEASHFASACSAITDAAAQHPELVAGVSPPRFDTDVMRATQGRLFAKGGADGVQVIGVVGEGVALAAKIDDGASRALEPLAVEVMRSLGYLSDTELDALARWTEPVISNADGIAVGEQVVVIQA